MLIDSISFRAIAQGAVIRKNETHVGTVQLVRLAVYRCVSERAYKPL